MAEETREASRTTVFISYSRDDLDFADQLDAALRLHKYDVALDRHGISGGEDWRDRLGALIRDADTVLFVLSPASAASEICKWEVSEAMRLGKRVIPVNCRPLHEAGPPPQLAALNYIFFYAEPRAPGSGFGTGLARLVAALDTDIDWVREHTRLLQRAVEWQDSGRVESRLLFGDSVTEAKAWAARRPKDAPEPTALHHEFIRASEQAERRRQDVERQQFEQMAIAQADRAKALEEREVAQEREAQHARRVVRRTVIGIGASLCLAVIAALFAARSQKAQAELQKALVATQLESMRTKHALARNFADRAWSELASGNRDLAVRYALAGWRAAPVNADHYRGPLAKAIASPSIPNSRDLHKGRVTSIAFSEDGRYAISGGADGLAVLLDAASLETLHQLHSGTRGTQPVTAVAIVPGGTLALTISTDSIVRLWATQSGQLVSEFAGHSDRINAAIFSPDARLLATASFDRTARLWDLATGRLLISIEGHNAGVSALAFSPDGGRLVTGGPDGSVHLWDTRTGQQLRVLANHRGGITAVSFAPDGTLLLTGAEDKTVRIWDLAKGDDSPRILTGHLSSIRAINLAPDGSKVYVVDLFGNAYIWDIQTARIIAASASGSEDYGFAAFGLGGAYAAISEKGGGLRVWDANAARTLIGLREQTEPPVSAMLWLGQRLFVGDQSGTLSVYHLGELTQSMSQLVARACAEGRSLSPRFSWMESATDPLIREVWDPKGTTRPVCD